MTVLTSQTIIGQSPAIQKAFDVVARVAASDSTILIEGETGTGKGLFARAIHNRSRRADQPFVALNCGAIPESLLESELFGHVRGSFTGATQNKMGKFELANGGTIFLDEIGDMSPDLQVKILRVLEEGEFEPVGGNRTISVDLRVIAATHRDLEARILQGLFREDLYYRIYVIPLKLPPLRDRRSDIVLLAEHFREVFNLRNNMNVNGFNQKTAACLASYNWPGNVRELRNLVERMVVLRQQGQVEVADLPVKIRNEMSPTEAESDAAPRIDIGENGISLNTAVTEFEKALILQSLEKANWVKNKAARLLHLNRTTLVEKIKRHQIQPLDAAFCGSSDQRFADEDTISRKAGQD